MPTVPPDDAKIEMDAEDVVKFTKALKESREVMMALTEETLKIRKIQGESISHAQKLAELRQTRLKGLGQELDLLSMTDEQHAKEVLALEEKAKLIDKAAGFKKGPAEEWLADWPA